MATKEEINKWYDSLSIKEKFNGWICRPQNFWKFTEKDWKEYDEETDRLKSDYYHRMNKMVP